MEELREEIIELRSRIDGLQIVLSAALNMLPEGDVLKRLALLEETARKTNMQSGTIETIRRFRETWQR